MYARILKFLKFSCEKKCLYKKHILRFIYNFCIFFLFSRGYKENIFKFFVYIISIIFKRLFNLYILSNKVPTKFVYISQLTKHFY